MLLTLIAIFLFASFGQAFDSQRNNKDISRTYLRGMQSAKEMLSSNQANFHTNPWKSETNNISTFERLSVPIPNDIPASTMSSFLSQLTVVPTPSFLHFHVPTNAISTATGLTSLNNIPIAHVYTTTATTTSTMTQVPATATTIVPTYHIDKCKATRTQYKTRSPSILHPNKKSANNATLHLLLPFNQENSAITISSLLLPRDSARPAITTATNATFSLQLIVESFSTGAKQVAPATIRNDFSSWLICWLLSEHDLLKSFTDSAIYTVPGWLLISFPSYGLSLTSSTAASHPKIWLLFAGLCHALSLLDMPEALLHFREDCRIFCEGEWEQLWHLNRHTNTGLVDFQHWHLNGHTGLLGWQCRQMCLSATPLKRQTFLSVADMSEMSSRHAGDILLCRPICRLSASCWWDLLPTNTPTFT